jgi:competence/damage-inducible protein CinA-like protein
MPSAEIIAIGTELLLGEISDTNTAFIAKALNYIGIDIYHTSMVGDNQARITKQIKQSIKHAEIVITTGGLGPTVDDPTRQAVADVFGEKLIFHEHLWKQIQSRFNAFNRIPTENNKKQAFIPQNAIPIENPVGTAPAFYISAENKTIICLPGVPAEMEYLLNNNIIHLLKKTYNLKCTTISRIIHTAGIGESSIDELIGDCEKLENPSVGITAKPGQVDIRVTAKASNQSQARSLIAPIEKIILEKVSKYVYGFDQETLYSVVSRLIDKENIHVILFHDTKNTDLISNLSKKGIFMEIRRFSGMDQQENKPDYSLYNNSKRSTMAIYLNECSNHKSNYQLTIIYGHNVNKRELRFGGHNVLVDTWIENNLLNSIREIIIQKKVKNE